MGFGLNNNTNILANTLNFCPLNFIKLNYNMALKRQFVLNTAIERFTFLKKTLN